MPLAGQLLKADTISAKWFGEKHIESLKKYLRNMDIVKIKVVGKASKKVISQYKRAFNYGSLSNNELLMFCPFSELDIPIGQEFSLINDLEEKREVKCQITLKNVTQQFWKAFDAIPAGWKTICLFEFESGIIPDVVHNLPIINDWYDSNTGVWFVTK